MADPDLQIRGGGGHPDPEIRGGDDLKKNYFRHLGPQFGLKEKGGGPAGPSLDPPLVTSAKQRRNPRSGPQQTNNGK